MIRRIMAVLATAAAALTLAAGPATAAPGDLNLFDQVNYQGTSDIVTSPQVNVCLAVADISALPYAMSAVNETAWRIEFFSAAGCTLSSRVHVVLANDQAAFFGTNQNSPLTATYVKVIQ